MKPKLTVKTKIIETANSFMRGYGVKLTIGRQSFELGYCGHTKEDAVLYENSLLVALDNLKSLAVQEYIHDKESYKKIQNQ